ncbi:MAG: hypothetical protein IT458_07575 [Planctomycetes bacterium]|nr:hypothetical protein [Planctomycetota bacterium]
MSVAKKVVLVSKHGYRSSHDSLLLSLIERRIELFCAVGQDCELWEEIMDELVVGPKGACPWHVTTTSHPGESVEQVVEFASLWHLDAGPPDVEIIEV